MNKVVIVTGASRGIGRGIAEYLARNGFLVIANYNKSEKEAEKLQKENEEVRVSNKKLYEIGQEMYKQDKYTSENYISKQTIKDKIEELNNISNAEKLEDIMIGGNYTITELVQYVLQELIEERSDANENM